MALTQGDIHRMQCLEVWGGNQAVDSAVVLTGLDAWVYSRPHRGSSAGGGDVHYVSSCASGRLSRLLVADVSGHGASAAAAGLQLRDLMRRYVNYISPARFVRAMNQSFAKQGNPGSFATAIVATYFLPTRQLSVCNAGHPSPLIYRAAAGQWSALCRPVDAAHPHADLPLGVEAKADYTPLRVRLEPGDCVLCFTDSLIEARGEAGRQIGAAGLLEIVRGLDPTRPNDLIHRLLARIESLRPENLDHDDVTLLLFKPNAQGVPMLDNLLSPIRVIGDLLSRLRWRIGRA